MFSYCDIFAGVTHVEPTRDELIRVASKVWGPPNVPLSNGTRIRFGTKGSKALDLQKRVWADHETGTGGGWVALYRLADEPLPRDDEPPPRDRPQTTYEYRGADGELLFEVVRLPGHRFFQRRPNGTGGWIPDLAGVTRVLYRLPELLASGDEIVWVAEGEKDVDNLRRCGLAATTNPMGAGRGKWLPSYSEALRGRAVALLPDNDEVGLSHMAAIAAALAGVARSVRTVVLPGLGEGEDVSDWLLRGGDAAGLERLYREAEPPRGVARLRSGTVFAGGYEVPNWLIDGVLQRGRLYACTSLTNHGKTAVWLHNACMVQAGRAVAGLSVDRAPTLYLAGENPTDLQGRMLGTMRELGLRELPYVLPEAFPMTEEELERLKAECRAMDIPWGLIVGDTAASFFPGDDENDNVQAAGYGRALRSLTELPGNPAVLVLSHPVKNAARDNLLPRGGGAFLNELDGNLVLWSENLGEMTQLHWQGKIRGPNFDPITFKYRLVETGLKDKRGRPDTTIVAEPIDDFEAANHAAQAIANEDAVLVHLNRTPDISLAQIATACGWINEAGVAEKWKAQRTVAKLKRDGLIKQFRNKWTITKAGEEVLAAEPLQAAVAATEGATARAAKRAES